MDAFLGLDPSNKDKLKRSQDQKKTKDETGKATNFHAASVPSLIHIKMSETPYMIAAIFV